MEKSKIKEEHPSLCYSCKHARKPATDSNIEKGWVGCAAYVQKMKQNNGDYGVENADFALCEELGEGWVDLRASVFGDSSGVTTNFMMLTRKTSKCREYYEGENR